MSKPARYDSALGAWLFTSHADVVAALHDSRLSGDGDPGVGTAHVAVREAARRALSPTQIAWWRPELESSARRLIAALHANKPVDLVRDFAEPWSLSIAAMASGANESDAPRLVSLAREVFLSAANATSPDVPSDSIAAAEELARALSRGDAREGASADVQSFVALSRTLPCALAGAWLELLKRPQDAARLRAEPSSMSRAVEELLRLAGPSRAIFRRALHEVEIGGARIPAGEHVVLMLSAANRDPAAFADPERFDLHRDGSGHVAFGRGAHSCSGASLIRTAMAIATRALLDDTTDVELAGDVTWIGGFAINGPASVPVVLRRASWGRRS